MKNKELFQRILSIYSKGVQSNDIRLTRRHIFNKLVTVRNILLSQYSDRYQRISIDAYQVLECIEMVPAPITECNCVPEFLLKNCTLYKSLKPIPNILKNRRRELISDITTIDGQVRLDFMNYASLKYQKGFKYASTKPFVFLYNDHLWMIGAEYELLQMQAIFENPTEVYAFSYCGCEEEVDCISYLEKEFPIGASKIEQLLTFAKQEMLLEFQYGVIDRSNNSQDNSNQQKQEAE